MWPKGTIVICVDDSPLYIAGTSHQTDEPSGLVKDYLYTVDSSGADNHDPVITTVEAPHKPKSLPGQIPSVGFRATRFRKLDLAHDETQIARAIRLERMVQELKREGADL